MYKQSCLIFPDYATNIGKKLGENKYKDRKRSDLEKFSLEVQEHFPVLCELYQKSFDLLKQERQRQRKLKILKPKKRHATFICDGMYDLLVKHYGEDKVRLEYGRYYLAIEDKYKIFFKKLGRQSYLPSNVPSENAFRLMSNKTTDLKDTASIIWIGYTVDSEKHWNRIEKICAVSTSLATEGMKRPFLYRNWVLDLNSVLSANQHFNNNVFPLNFAKQNTTPPLNSIISVKKGAKKKDKRL